jgi:c-di-GMP-binding flagellar brake protein YcgR
VEAKEEKRKNPRVKTHIPIRFRKLRDEAGADGTMSISKNLSEGGIHFRSGGFVSRACRLILELDIPMFSKPVKAISKVAWIRKTENGNEYEVGNRFLEMTKEDKELISEYVDSLILYRNSERKEVNSEVATQSE